MGIEITATFDGTVTLTVEKKSQAKIIVTALEAAGLTVEAYESKKLSFATKSPETNTKKKK